MLSACVTVPLMLLTLIFPSIMHRLLPGIP
jgi:hypothetical protein